MFVIVDLVAGTILAKLLVFGVSMIQILLCVPIKVGLQSVQLRSAKIRQVSLEDWFSKHDETSGTEERFGQRGLYGLHRQWEMNTFYKAILTSSKAIYLSCCMTRWVVMSLVAVLSCKYLTCLKKS